MCVKINVSTCEQLHSKGGNLIQGFFSSGCCSAKEKSSVAQIFQGFMSRHMPFMSSSFFVTLLQLHRLPAAHVTAYDPQPAWGEGRVCDRGEKSED